MEKNAKKYHCIKCDFFTSNKYDFTRHLSTAKHKMDNKNAKIHKKNAKPYVVTNCDVRDKKYKCACGRTYKYHSGLCKHRHKCVLLNSILVNSQNKQSGNLVTTEMLNNALSEQKQLINTIIELSKDKSVNNYYNNCNNKKMTVNVFLNEECKDAMNFKDFIGNLTVSFQDLDYTKEHGYAKGISNIFVNHLKDMDPNERPIHCSDKKRLQFYVKDDNKWEKDKNNTKINNSINEVSRKQIKQLIEWQKQHPNYETNDKLLEEYFNITRHVMGGGDINEIVQYGNDIKKTLSTEVEIKDAMLNPKND